MDDPFLTSLDVDFLNFGNSAGIFAPVSSMWDRVEVMVPGPHHEWHQR